MFFKINKCIFIGVRMKAFTMQSKNKIGAWAHMRPPPPPFLFLLYNTRAFSYSQTGGENAKTNIFENTNNFGTALFLMF